jgi:hypothetical protein
MVFRIKIKPTARKPNHNGPPYSRCYCCDGPLLAHNVLLEPLLQGEFPSLFHLSPGLVLFELFRVGLQGLLDYGIPYQGGQITKISAFFYI